MLAERLSGREKLPFLWPVWMPTSLSTPDAEKWKDYVDRGYWWHGELLMREVETIYFSDDGPRKWIKGVVSQKLASRIIPPEIASQFCYWTNLSPNGHIGEVEQFCRTKGYFCEEVIAAACLLVFLQRTHWIPLSDTN